MFCGFPLCTSETLGNTFVLPPHLFVTRENNKVIKSFWGVFGCGWCLDAVLLRFWFPVLAMSSHLLTFQTSKAFALITVRSVVQYKTCLCFLLTTLNGATPSQKTPHLKDNPFVFQSNIAGLHKNAFIFFCIFIYCICFYYMYICYT